MFRQIIVISIIVLIAFYFFLGSVIEKNRDIAYKVLAFEHTNIPIPLWQTQLRSKMIQLSGASQVLPVASLISRELQFETESYITEKLELEFGEGKRVFCRLFSPKSEQKGLTPAIVVFPGHGEGLEEVVAETDSGANSYQQGIASHLASGGFVVLSCEPWAFWSSSEKPEQFDVAMNEQLLKGKSVMGIYIDQARAEIGFLEKLEGVDPKRIGMAGVSMGGAVTFYTAALDERIQASFVSGFLTTFEDTYFKHPHSTVMIIPGLYQYADIPDIAGLIAPRAVMFDNGEADKTLALPGDEAEALINASIKPIFKAFNSEETVMVNKTDKGHVIDKEAALDFFRQRLMP